MVPSMVERIMDALEAVADTIIFSRLLSAVAAIMLAVCVVIMILTMASVAWTFAATAIGG